MVTATFVKNHHLYKTAEINGHALFNNSGSDIVCAGISAVVFGCMNSLLIHAQVPESRFDDFILIDNQNNRIYIDFSKVNSKYVEAIQIIFETLYISLKSISDEYPENLTINI